MEVYVGQFVLFLLLFVRITSMIVVAPLLGHQSVPVYVKVGLGMFLSFVLYPLMAGKAHVDLQLFAFIVAVLQEAAVGLLIGFATGLLFAGVRFAGELVSVHMGLSFATMLDPESNQNNAVIGEFLYLFTALIFILMNGHHFLLEALYLSYSAVPIASFSFSSVAGGKLIDLSAMVFVIGVKFAAPVIVAMFINNVALAILSKVVPQMNIFSVSFPLNIGVGLLVLMTTAPLVVYVFKKSLSVFESNVLELIRLL